MEFKNKFNDYFQLTKPGIVFGNLIIGAAGFLFGAKGNISWAKYLGVLVGLGLIIASACVFNNYLDRDIDKKMQRTKNRALVSGKINSSQALIFGTILGAVGFIILPTLVNSLTTYIAAAAFIFYVVLYGVAKRQTVHGALIGSLPGAAPPVIGYTAATNQLDGAALILFLTLIFWQMPHFYGIALYRLKEYRAAGIPVMPSKIGAFNTKFQSILYMIGFIVAAVALPFFGYASWTYAIVVGCFGFFWLVQSLRGFRQLSDAKWGRQVFTTSMTTNLVVAAMLSLNWLLIR